MKTITVSLWQGDSLERLQSIESKSIGSVICDPPYGVLFDDEDEYKKMTGVHGRGQEMRGGFSYGGSRLQGYCTVDTDKNNDWNRRWLCEVHRILQDTGRLKAFAATRMYHHLAKLIEDVGFVDLKINAWVYSKAMPKGMDIAGSIRRRRPSSIKEAGLWEGYNTTLKPSWEVILEATKTINL